jgi:RNA polymerase sigma factor (sigma-70 family)
LSDVARTIAAIFRIELPKLVARLARVVRDVGRAEELAQDAMVIALERWPAEGVPDNPGAWLVTTAKRRAIDQVRRAKLVERAHDELGHDSEPQAMRDPDDDIGDDLLRLVFTACHPVLPTEARVALTLRLLGGLTTAEIARAFLVPEATIAQRIVRAKRTLAEAGVPFEVPVAVERVARLASVLEVIYLIFNEGYAATAGDDWMRPELCADAQRLARTLAGLQPSEPEVFGVLALVELQASRLHARTAADGAPILLLDQDRARWDHLLIRRGLQALARAEQLGGARGPYALQAAIAACHARARTAADTDWPKIAALYAALMQVAPSPIVELNRAVAVGMALGPAAGLAVVDVLAEDGSLADYHLLPSVRADLLAKLGRIDEARAELVRAAELATNRAERELLRARAAKLASPAP